MNKTSHIAVLLLSLSLFGCGGGGGGGGDETPAPTDPGDTTAPSVSAQSPTQRLIKPDTGITLRFDESIDTGSFTLGGSLAAESDGGVWSQTDVIDDTLTITPTTSWPVDTGRTLVINAKDLAGNAIAELTLTHDVYRGTLYYISNAMADDTGNGETPATARKYIYATVADVTAPATILVAEGEYRLSSAAIHQTQMVLKEGVSLYGGYNADFTQRDPAGFISRIVDRSTDAGIFESPNRAVEGDASITALTIIDGFTIDGSTQAGSKYNSGILLIGSSPTVQNNTINGGGGTESYGLYNNAASPIVQNNTINGGSGADVSYGIRNTLSSPIVHHNTIDAGSSGFTSYGMHNNNYSSPIVHHNTLSGGNSRYESYGMYNQNASSTVHHNTLNGGSGGVVSYGMYNASASSPSVHNNTINGGSGGSNSYGMYNNSGSTATVHHNTLNGGSGGGKSYGMYNISPSLPPVHDNTIDGGSGNTSYGMYNFRSSSPVHNNTIDGGSGDTSYGMYNISSSSPVHNNTINGGSGDTSFGIFNDNSSSTLVSNTLLTRPGVDTYCFYEADASSDPAALYYNVFATCEVLYFDADTGDITDIDAVNALADISGGVFDNTYSETIAP